MSGGSPIIAELKSIQHTHGFVPVAALRALSERTGTPLYQLHGVVSFFPHFRTTPPPTVEVLVCDDMSCHRRGGGALLTAVEQHVAQSGPPGAVVKPVSCLGRCDRAPACVVNDTIVSRVTLESLVDQITTAAGGGKIPHEKVTPAGGKLMTDPYENESQRYGAARRLATDKDVAAVIAALKAANLRGMGGAGFPTGLKWEFVRNAAGGEKYIVCNGDESEPGTIKDRYILENAPHLLVEGMLLAGLVTGAKEGIVYIRHEYEAQTEIVDREIERAKKLGALGDDVFGSGLTFHLETFTSPGGYICGEESALLEAIEGKRGEPRNKPPFPVTHGLWNKPTVINNVETFVMVPYILMKGAESFKAQGKTAAGPGFKFVGISGDVARPGIYEIPMGTPAREVIFGKGGGIAGGRPFKAWAPSGPSSGYLPPSLVDTPLDFKALADVGSMLGSGAIVVCSDQACMLDMALNAVRFFKNESCGKCVPCRVGSAKMLDVLNDIAHGRGKPEHVAMIDDLTHTLMLASICGLGQVVPVPIKSVLLHFRDEIDEHLLRHRCPANVCPMGV